VYAAVAAAGFSVLLGTQAGASLDFALLRSVFIFVVITALAFGAEAVLTVGVQPLQPSEAQEAAAETLDE
jgi:predicted secreted protein